jgi:hypothetical protein
MLYRMGLFLVLISATAAAQQSKPAGAEDTGHLYVDRTHAAWPSPESLVRDLRSGDDDVRLEALRLLGFGPQETHMEIWSQTQPSRPVGQAVVAPDRIEVSYAALGEDATRQVIVAVEADQKQMTFAAVAVPTARGWERIATFDCWCKYEMYQTAADPLAESVQLRPAPEPRPQTPQHFELVLRASGGGTGIYTQNEGHFRLHQGELRLVMTFVSGQQRCDPTGPTPRWCDIEKRWFYTTGFGNVLGGVLVTTRGRFPSDNAPEVLWVLRNSENRFLGEPTCSTYKWNAQSFQYEPLAATDPCKPRAQ